MPDVVGRVGFPFAVGFSSVINVLAYTVVKGTSNRNSSNGCWMHCERLLCGNKRHQRRNDVTVLYVEMWSTQTHFCKELTKLQNYTHVVVTMLLGRQCANLLFQLAFILHRRHCRRTLSTRLQSEERVAYRCLPCPPRTCRRSSISLCQSPHAHGGTGRWDECWDH